MRVALRIQPEEQIQFGRRRRDLHDYYRIDKKRVGKKTVYIIRALLKFLATRLPQMQRRGRSGCTWRMGAAACVGGQ